jgi:hypothetical protein
MIGCYGVFPDGVARPVAVFRELEDAMDWALERYGGNAFDIRYVEMMRVESGDANGRPRAA